MLCYNLVMKFQVGGFMSKIKIKVTLKNKDEENIQEQNAILEDNKIKYKEDKNTTVIWNEKENTLYRETNELRIRYPFQEKKTTEGTVELKQPPLEIKVPIHTKKLERKNHNVTIEFKVEENEMLYCIEEII